jgi:hypothetical protein
MLSEGGGVGGHISSNNGPVGSATTGTISLADKCRLLEMLRLGRSYKVAVHEFKKESGKAVSIRTLCRLAASFVQGDERNGLARITDRRKERSGRGNSSMGAFTRVLGDHLNSNFVTRKGLPYRQCWTYWHLEEIRFWLIFNTLPIRIALMEERLTNQPMVSHALDENWMQWTWHKWADWYNTQIAEQLASRTLDMNVISLMDTVRQAFPMFTLSPFAGKLKFCERSIRLALKNSGYCESKALRFVTSPVWHRSVPPDTGELDGGTEPAVLAVCEPDDSPKPAFD